jgi:hypothetical protein
MKKILIIVLVMFMLLGIGGVVLGYVFIYRPAKAYVVSLGQLQEIPKLEEQVRNRETFLPPANGELTPERITRFVQTQQVIRQRLGTRLEELDRKYKALNPRANEDRTPSVSEALGALKDLAGLVLEAKKYQVDALNQNAFSVQEYDWTRARVYEASGIPLELTFQRALRDAAAGKKPNFDRPDTGAIEVPAKNRTLVAPHVKQLTDTAPLAFFGL